MKYRIGKIAMVVALVAVPFALSAQSSGGPYDLTRHTIDGGGGTSAGGNFSLTGTIGQPDAQRSDGGQFVLHGGFWGGPAQVAENLFRDGFEI